MRLPAVLGDDNWSATVTSGVCGAGPLVRRVVAPQNVCLAEVGVIVAKMPVHAATGRLERSYDGAGYAALALHRSVELHIDTGRSDGVPGIPAPIK